MISRYFLPIFDPATAIGAVAVNTGKAIELEEGFRRLGFDVERRELPSFGGEDDGNGNGDESMGSPVESGDMSADGKSVDGMEDVRSP